MDSKNRSRSPPEHRKSVRQHTDHYVIDNLHPDELFEWEPDNLLGRSEIAFKASGTLCIYWSR